MSISQDENNKVMDDLKIRFDGDSNFIDANTLINNLLHFSSVIQEVNKELNTGRKVDIKIRAIEKGSFIIDIIIESNILQGIKNIFSNASVEYSSEIVTIATGLYGLAKLIRGKKAKPIQQNGNNVTIQSNEGEVKVFNIQTVNIYNNNNTVKEAIQKQFETLENDDNVTALEFWSKDDKPIVRIPADEFSDIAAINEPEEPIDNRIVTKAAILNIFKLVFDNNVKWEFYYEGNKISAKMTDTKFIERIDKGEQFAKGDTLKVEMDIYQTYNQAANTFVNKSYTIIKIIKHIPRPKQGNIFNQN